MKTDREKTERTKKNSVIQDIWRWAKASRLPIACLCILNLIVSCGSLMIVIGTRGLIDGAAEHDSRQMLVYAALMVAAVIVIRVSGLISGRLTAKTNAVLLGDLRKMMLNKLLKKQYAGLDRFHSGELVNRVFSDVAVVRNGITEVIPGLVSMTVGFVGAAVILFWIDWRFVLLLVVGGLLGLALIAAFHRPMTARHKAVQEAEGGLHAAVQELLENLRLIQASGSAERMERRTDSRQQLFLKAQLRKGYFSAYMNNSIYLVFQVSWLICMLWGCYEIFRGNLTYGMLAAILQLVGQIQGPISGVAGVAGQVYSTLSSAERLKELLDLSEEEPPVLCDGNAMYRHLKEIKLTGVDFSYGRALEPVLKQVNLSISPGAFIAVTGASGSGKSTLFQLLLGIYRPTGGELKFSFENASETDAAAMRRLFAYVPQGNTLFSGTLRENLAMFTESATDAEIMEAAELACIASFIVELPDGLNTVIGERGIGLSEGQAQRIAVARALLSRAPILLLDECTSALDEATEAKMLQNIASLREKTCLIVTHRRAALQICNFMIHIDSGNVEKYSG